MIIDFLAANPILTLFVIIALGYLIGRIKIGGFSLGIAGTLFAGIAISALDDRLALPPFIYTIGLVLFVYTTGIALGPTFFGGLKKTGLRDNVFVFCILLFGVAGALLTALLLGLGNALGAGTYTGAFTVTPALASIMEALGGNNAEPVVGYSLAYPFSIIISLVLLGGFRKYWKIDRLEARRKDTSLNPHTIKYTRAEPCSVQALPEKTGIQLTVSRLRSGSTIHLPSPDEQIRTGDLVTIVSTPDGYQRAMKWMGEPADTNNQLESQSQSLKERRVFVSDNQVVGRTIGELDLYGKFHVLPTRVRRGDVDMVISQELIVEAGDRVKIVGAHKDIDAVADFLGDSYRKVSEVNIFAFAVGIALGVALGSVALPLPGGREFALGAAGGTIIVALILGAIRRTGHIVWQLPYGTNLAIRQLGLVIFLAGVGSQAGSALVEALLNPLSYQLMGAVIVLCFVVGASMLLVGYKILRIPFSRLSGMLAAMNTQPATLAFANTQTKTDDANAGFASVYPLSLIGKIILAQLLLIFLS